jgi:hypothetical protein
VTITVEPDLRFVMVYVGGCMVNPDEVEVGAIVSVKCSGFRSNELVDFYWESDGFVQVATVKANSAGYAAASFAVPEFTVDPNMVLAVGEQSGEMAGGVARVRFHP